MRQENKSSSASHLDEITRAIDKIRFGRSFPAVNPYGTISARSNLDNNIITIVAGRVPASFLSWFKQLRGRNHWEHQLLSRCHFKEI